MIPEIKKILYATDLSEGARRALGYAASIANRFGAGVTILHVIEDTSPYQDSLVMNILGEDRWQQLRAENEEKVISMIKDKVKNFCDEISKEMPACPFVTDDIIARIGHPVEEILKMAKDIQAAMLTAGCLMRQSSISAGPILYPALVITSSLRPTNQKYPSSSFFARSPVKSHFPRYFSLVASGFPPIFQKHYRIWSLYGNFPGSPRANRVAVFINNINLVPWNGPSHRSRPDLHHLCTRAHYKVTFCLPIKFINGEAHNLFAPL